MNVETATRLVKLRKQYGISQEELAEKIGVSRQAVSKWERAESSPDTDNLIALADVYHLSIDDMLHSNKAEASKSTVYDSADYDSKKSGFNWVSFPYPIVATIIYFILGFVFNAWHPGWLIFLTVPLWAFFVNKGKKSEKNDSAKLDNENKTRKERRKSKDDDWLN